MKASGCEREEDEKAEYTLRNKSTSGIYERKQK